MSTTWPTFLPIARRGQDYRPAAQTTRTEMEHGPARVRRRHTAAATYCEVEWTLTTAQLQAFDAWYEIYLAGGAEWMTDVTLQTSAGLAADFTARFVDESIRRQKLSGDYWSISTTVEVGTIAATTPAWPPATGLLTPAEQYLSDGWLFGYSLRKKLRPDYSGPLFRADLGDVPAAGTHEVYPDASTGYADLAALFAWADGQGGQYIRVVWIYSQGGLHDMGAGDAGTLDIDAAPPFASKAGGTWAVYQVDGTTYSLTDAYDPARIGCLCGYMPAVGSWGGNNIRALATDPAAATLQLALTQFDGSGGAVTVFEVSGADNWSGSSPADFEEIIDGDVIILRHLADAPVNLAFYGINSPTLGTPSVDGGSANTKVYLGIWRADTEESQIWFFDDSLAELLEDDAHVSTLADPIDVTSNRVGAASYPAGAQHLFVWGSSMTYLAETGPYSAAGIMADDAKKADIMQALRT